MARYGGTNTVQVGQFNSAQSDFVWLMTEDNFATAAIDGGAQSILNGGGNLRCYTDNTKTTQLPIQVVQFVTGLTPSIVVKGLSPLLDDSGTVYIEADTVAISQPPVTDTYGRNSVYADFEDAYNMNSVPTVTNSTGNTDGTAINGVTVSSNGKIGDALDFDGASSQRVDCGAATNIGTQYTFSAWCSTEDAAAVQTVISSRLGNNASISVVPYQTLILNNKFSIYVNDGSGSGFLSVEDASTVSNNTFYKVTGVRDGNNLSLYIDGALSGSSSKSLGSLSLTNVEKNIGAIQTSLGTIAVYFDGLIDDNYVRKDALSADYIEAEYNNENNPSAFWSVGAWEDQDAGGLIVDSLISPQGIENVILSTIETVTPDNLISQQFITEPSITQGYILSVDSIITGQSIENVSLAVSGQLNVDSLQNLQLLSSPALTQNSQISVDGLINAQSLSESALSTGDELIVQNIGNIQSISDSGFIQQHVLITNNITNTQLLGVVTFSGEGQDIGTVTAAFKESDIDVTYGIANFTVMFKD